MPFEPGQGSRCKLTPTPLTPPRNVDAFDARVSPTASAEHRRLFARVPTPDPYRHRSSDSPARNNARPRTRVVAEHEQRHRALLVRAPATSSAARVVDRRTSRPGRVVPRRRTAPSDRDRRHRHALDARHARRSSSAQPTGATRAGLTSQLARRRRGRRQPRGRRPTRDPVAVRPVADQDADGFARRDRCRVAALGPHGHRGDEHDDRQQQQSHRRTHSTATNPRSDRRIVLTARGAQPPATAGANRGQPSATRSAGQSVRDDHLALAFATARRRGAAIRPSPSARPPGAASQSAGWKTPARLRTPRQRAAHDSPRRGRRAGSPRARTTAARTLSRRRTGSS